MTPGQGRSQAFQAADSGGIRPRLGTIFQGTLEECENYRSNNLRYGILFGDFGQSFQTLK